MKMFKVNSESFISPEKVVAVDYTKKDSNGVTMVTFLFENDRIIHYNLSPSESWEDFMERLAASQN